MSPYQRIMRAAHRRTGVRLSAEDVAQLARDEAVIAAASNDDDPERAAEDMAIDREIRFPNLPRPA